MYVNNFLRHILISNLSLIFSNISTSKINEFENYCFQIPLSSIATMVVILLGVTKIYIPSTFPVRKHRYYIQNLPVVL